MNFIKDNTDSHKKRLGFISDKKWFSKACNGLDRTLSHIPQQNQLTMLFSRYRYFRLSMVEYQYSTVDPGTAKGRKGRGNGGKHEL